jgi:hypothetical protein
MARTANPDKPKIDALRVEGKDLVRQIKAGNTALKKLLSVNAKLAKFETAEIPVPETAAPTAKAKAAPAKAAAKPVVKKAAKAEVKPAPKLAKGTKGKSVTTAPKKRGRPAKNDELDFDA